MDKAACDGLCKDLRVGADVMSMNDVFPTGQSMMKQAADEIERLRAALERHRENRDRQQEAINILLDKAAQKETD